MAKIFEKLMGNSSLVLFVIGTVMLIIGATGGVESPSFTMQIDEIIWQVVLSIAGLLFASLGAIGLMQVTNTSKTISGDGVTKRIFLDEPVSISSSRKNQLRIDGDFLLWEKCTIMLWVLVPPKGEGLRKAPNNRYILAHNTGQVDDGDYSRYYNQFCLRYSLKNQWQVVFSNDKGKYEGSNPTIDDGLVPGWHHFLISWDISRPKLLFAIDGLKSGSDIMTTSFSGWPQKISGKISVGAWTTDYAGHYCETKLFHLVVVDKYLEQTDSLVKEHLEKAPQN